MKVGFNIPLRSIFKTSYTRNKLNTNVVGHLLGTMKLSGQIFLGLILTTSCWGQKTSDAENIKNSVTTFYQWYIGTTKDSRYSSYVHGAPGERGKTKLETIDYFKRLDSLGVIGQDFVKSEKERFRPCDSLLNTVPWSAFSTADAYEYDSKCYWLYYYYWTYGQEPHDGVEVLDIIVNKNLATATANLYFGDNKSSGDKVNVYLTKTKGKWLIIKMEKRK